MLHALVSCVSLESCVSVLGDRLSHNVRTPKIYHSQDLLLFSLMDENNRIEWCKNKEG